jgi:broad specificity phosphatase PhoE
MKYVAALYAGNRVVTGMNHGDAFSKLQECERNGDIESGFLDPETGRFFTDDYDFYLKQIYLVRHAESEGQHFHANLTEHGRQQATKCAAFLCSEVLDDFRCLSSPADRCHQTAEIIADIAAVPLELRDVFRCQKDEESDASFKLRVAESLAALPPKSVIVTHTDYIITFVEAAIREAFRCGIPNCAVTYIEHRRLYRRFPEQWL